MKLDSRVGKITEKVLCRTIGCSSLLSKLGSWPYTKVCHPFVMWRMGKEMGTNWWVIKDVERSEDVGQKAQTSGYEPQDGD